MGPWNWSHAAEVYGKYPIRPGWSQKWFHAGSHWTCNHKRMEKQKKPSPNSNLRNLSVPWATYVGWEMRAFVLHVCSVYCLFPASERSVLWLLSSQGKTHSWTSTQLLFSRSEDGCVTPRGQSGGVTLNVGLRVSKPSDVSPSTGTGCPEWQWTDVAEES